MKHYKFKNNRWIRSKLPSVNLQVMWAPASCSLAPQNPSLLHKNYSLINKHGWPFCLIWPQTTRFNTLREYSSLATKSAQQCNTCYGRDGTTPSRSINTDRGSAALVLTRKQKAIVWPSVSFQQGSPGFKFEFFKRSLSQLLPHCSSSCLHRFTYLLD